MKQTLYYTAQVASILAFLVYGISFWFKDRKKILGMQVGSSSLYTIQYFLLGGYSGLGVNAIGIIKSLIFSNKKNNSKYWLWIFSIAYTAIGILTWDSMISLLPIIASLQYTVLSYNDNPQYIRLGSIIASVFWIIYNFSILAYAGCITEFILMISNILAVAKHKNKSRAIEESLTID